ncbi:MAG: 2-oxoglutarate dehydrogenase E1 component, partial [Verrucomicrobia bacterium]|nr:2-oxoglutarate dehydrogenase E1 component [Verrucomicrobiota bacterium]
MRTSYLNDWNADLLDEYYQRWKQDPASVDSSWSAFFEGFELGSASGRNGEEQAIPAAAEVDETDQLRARVDTLVQRYRILGHLQASLDPVGDAKLKVPALSLEELGLADVPLNRAVASRYFRQGARMPLGEMVDTLKKIYSDSIGIEFMHIQDEKVRDWVRERVEARTTGPAPDAETQI